MLKVSVGCYPNLPLTCKKKVKTLKLNVTQIKIKLHQLASCSAASPSMTPNEINSDENQQD